MNVNRRSILLFSPLLLISGCGPLRSSQAVFVEWEIRKITATQQEKDIMHNAVSAHLRTIELIVKEKGNISEAERQNLEIENMKATLIILDELM